LCYVLEREQIGIKSQVSMSMYNAAWEIETSTVAGLKWLIGYVVL